MASAECTKTLEDLYHEAYACVDQGICYDEVGQRDGALAMYERGLRLIDEASRLPNAESSDMYRKMSRAREHVVFRLKDLRSGGGASPNTAIPPPYECIDDALQAFGNTKNAEELFSILDGVQIFFVNGDETSVPSYPTSLKIFKFLPPSAQPKGGTVHEMPPAFLQVGDWIYPLAPGRSPVLHSTYGAYIFPNPTVEIPDGYVGVMLPPNLDDTVVQQFNKYMDEFTVLKEQEVQPELTPKEKEQLSTKIARYLITGGEYVAWGLKEGAQKSLQAINKKSTDIVTKTPKTEKPITIDPRVQSSVHYLRRGTKIAVKVSGYLVEKVGDLACYMGKSIAKSAQKRFPKSEGGSGGKVVHGVIEVATGGLAGFSSVWLGLEEASTSLAKGISNETVKVVDHKYGEEAASVTDNLLHSAGHSATAFYHFDTLGFKGIAKRTAKHAGLTILNDLSESSKKSNAGTKKDEATASAKA